MQRSQFKPSSCAAFRKDQFDRTPTKQKWQVKQSSPLGHNYVKHPYGQKSPSTLANSPPSSSEKLAPQQVS